MIVPVIKAFDVNVRVLDIARADNERKTTNSTESNDLDDNKIAPL